MKTGTKAAAPESHEAAYRAMKARAIRELAESYARVGILRPSEGLLVEEPNGPSPLNRLTEQLKDQPGPTAEEKGRLDKIWADVVNQDPFDLLRESRKESMRHFAVWRPGEKTEVFDA